MSANMEHLNKFELILEIEALKQQLVTKQNLLKQLESQQQVHVGQNNKVFRKEEVIRYSRQMLMLGTQSQHQLSLSSVLIIGAGGIGCPAALYLCGAGIGKIGIVDHDVVKLDNLHRQILYREHDLKSVKVEVAAASLKSLNSNVAIEPIHVQITRENALNLIKQYDVVMDATDNVVTRYLLNDACVLSGRSLVSGSALRAEGQLTVYNYKGGPCYRCLFPDPPPANCVTNCNEGGVLGPVPGIVGTLGALEAMKVILELGNILSSQLLLYDGLESTFRKVKLRSRLLNCSLCGNEPSITKLVDYEEFCGSKADDEGVNVSLLGVLDRISASELSQKRISKHPHVLVDVRTSHEFDMCHIEGSINVPITQINRSTIETILSPVDGNIENFPVYFICRRGNDSQRAVLMLQNQFAGDKRYIFQDIVGGLYDWADHVDPMFPKY